MEVTDIYQWLRVIVCNAFIGNVEVVRILRSTYPSNLNTPDMRKYIFPMVFRLAISGSGRNLRTLMNKHL